MVAGWEEERNKWLLGGKKKGKNGSLVGRKIEQMVAGWEEERNKC